LQDELSYANELFVLCTFSMRRNKKPPKPMRMITMAMMMTKECPGK
jgi:hypothetical protein